MSTNKGLHHIAIIVSSESGMEFYKVLGFIEDSRIDRGYDQIVWMSGFDVKLEIFIDGTHPERVTNPEALGLRHIAFVVDEIETVWHRLSNYNPEPLRITTDGKRMFFVKDPDGLPVEIRE